MQARVRKATLVSLEDGPKTPSNIAGITGEHLSHISRALKELSEKQLVECMTPERSKNRIYQITQKGKELIIELRKMD
jgi:ArsR family transcriptional regulator, cadmium/lead-responsive transcriptional repressor